MAQDASTSPSSLRAQLALTRAQRSIEEAAARLQALIPERNVAIAASRQAASHFSSASHLLAKGAR